MTRSNVSNKTNKTILSNDDIKQLLNDMKTEILAAIDKRLYEFINKIETISSKVENLEKHIYSMQLTQKSHKEDIECMKKQINENKNIVITDAIAEIKQRDEKRCNLILYGVDESETGNVWDRKQHDADVCYDILMNLNVKDKTLVQIKRIGRLRSDRKRLLQIVCNSEEQKFELLRKAKHLRNSQHYNSVYIKNDLTLFERDLQRKMKEDVKERRKKGEDAVIYRNQVVLRSQIKNFQ